MENKYRVLPIEGLANFKTGKLNSNAAKPDGAFPFFTCSQETFRTDTCSFDGEYVLLAGNNAAGIFPLKYFNGKFDAYQRTYVINAIDENALVTRYLYYALRPQLEHMKSISTGVATKFLTLSLLNRTEIPVPPPPTQRKIAVVLSAYDDLIENNLQRIKVLEEMAQNLYREWFVKFRFPNHQHVSFVASQIGTIPEGWVTTSIGNITSHISRGISPAYDDSSSSLVVNQKCIRDHKVDLGLARRHIWRVHPDKCVRFGDVLINSTGIGTLGRVAQIYEVVSDITVDTHVSIVRPQRSEDIDYLGLALMDMESHFESLGLGATGQTELRRDRISETDVLVPPLDLRKAFSSAVAPIRRLGINLLATNTTLRRTRDLLLPRLISGEVDVSDLDIVVPGEVVAS